MVGCNCHRKRTDEQYTRAAKSRRYVFLQAALKAYRPKAEKEAVLGEMRELEVALGLPSQPYNGSDDKSLRDADRVDVV